MRWTTDRPTVPGFYYVNSPHASSLIQEWRYNVVYVPYPAPADDWPTGTQFYGPVADGEGDVMDPPPLPGEGA